jgi:hypothetical protein
LVILLFSFISLEKPLILSDKFTLRHYFENGAVYSMNEKYDIRKNILFAINNLEQMKEKSKITKRKINKIWREYSEELKNEISKNTK